MYKDQFANHESQANHKGSSGSMEPAGILSKMFIDPKRKRNCDTTKYIGDEDSSAFKTLQESKLYGDDEELDKIRMSQSCQD